MNEKSYWSDKNLRFYLWFDFKNENTFDYFSKVYFVLVNDFFELLNYLRKGNIENIYKYIISIFKNK